MRSASDANPPFVLRWQLLVLAVLMVGVVLSGTPGGLGITPDSLQYLQAATSILTGNGFSEFSSHWPPLYPLAIATASGFSGEALASARWLNAGLAATNLVLLASIARRCGWRDDVAAVVLLLLGLQAGFFHVHFLAWSEPLFLTFVLADLLSLHMVLQDKASRWAWRALVASAAAAIMVRYAGLFLLAVNACMLLLSLSRPMRFRAKAAIGVSGVSLLPFLAWIWFNHERGVEGVNRSIAWHLPSAEHVNGLQDAIAVWSGLPDAASLPILAFVLAVAAWHLAAAKRNPSPVTVMLAASGTCLLAYSAFLFVSISFVDHHTPLDERLLFPMFPFVWLLLWHAAANLQGKTLRWAALSLLSLLLIRGAWHGWEDWRYTRHYGLGLTSRHIQAMPVLAWLRTLPSELPIVSNGPDLCTIYLQRPGDMLPRIYDATSRQPNPDFQAELEAKTKGPILVVHFQAMTYRTYLPGPETLEKLPNMRLVYQGEDATAWIRNANQPLQ